MRLSYRVLARCELFAILEAIDHGSTPPDQRTNSIDNHQSSQIAEAPDAIMRDAATLPEATDQTTVSEMQPLKTSTAPLVNTQNEHAHAESSDTAWDSPERREAMRFILFYRAVLWMIYISTATDISEIYNSEVGQRIVQIL